MGEKLIYEFHSLKNISQIDMEYDLTLFGIGDRDN
jgi:hypothetical protein